MNQNLFNHVLEFLRRKMWSKRWQRAVTCLAAVAVFGVTYALVLPAITMTGKYPTLKADETIAWSGDKLCIQVSAESDIEDGDRIITLALEGENADLSDSYVFNEEGICIVTDAENNEIELHRSLRETEGKEPSVVDYWFVLKAGEQTELSLELADEIDEARFAELVDAMKQDADSGAEKATASDAGKSAAVAVNGATASDAEKTETEQQDKATVSDAVLATGSDAVVLVEKDDDGFEQILDGAIVNDLEAEEEDEEEPSQIVASLKVSAGIGEDYEAAVMDAERNADKRGDAQLLLKWKDIIAQKASESVITANVNDATIAVFYDAEAEIPANASLSVTEFVKGSEEYEAYLAETRTVMATATQSDATKSVTNARFFDIKILDEDGNEVEPSAPVKVVISYDDLLSIAEDGSMKVMHFGKTAPEVLNASALAAEEETAVEAVGFTADSFSVYGVFGMETVTAQYVTVDGDTFTIKVSLNEKEDIRGQLGMEVAEITADQDVYGQYLTSAQEAMKLTEDDEIAKARFFDIKLFVDGQKFEPAYPATVQITCDESLKIQESQELEMVHFAEEKTEVISEVKLNESGNELTYEQTGFSVVGMIVWHNTNNNWPDRVNDYIMVVGSATAGYFIINHNDLTAVPVTFDAANNKITLNNAEAEANKDNYLWRPLTAANKENTSSAIQATGVTPAKYLDLMNEALTSTSQRTYSWSGRKLRTGAGSANNYYYFGIENGKLVRNYNEESTPGLEVYFAAFDVTLKLYPCEYKPSGRSATAQHYLPVSGAPLSVTVPYGEIIVVEHQEDSDPHAYSTGVETDWKYFSEVKIPVQYFSALESYGFDPNGTSCPLVSGISETRFKSNSAVKTSGPVLNTGYSPTACRYETIEGKKYVVLRKYENENAQSADRDWRNVYYAMLEVANDTVSPASTVINVFDYWTDPDDRFAEDAFRTLATGINGGATIAEGAHPLHFFHATSAAYGYVNNGYGTLYGAGLLNYSSAMNGVTQGFVNRNLGADGYPHLTVTSGGAPGGSTYTDSLNYLFDPEVPHAGKVSFTNATGLLRVNSEGNYFYNSAERGVQFDESSKSFIEYTTPVMIPGGQSPFGQYFPFEEAHQVALQSDIARGIQHYFGMTMTTRFAQVYGGHTDHTRTQAVKYHFAGDDDMWVFMDGVLVADLGGAHSAHTLDIDFTTGKVTINKVYRAPSGQPTGVVTTTIRDQFIAAGKEGDAANWNGNTFADDTFHTLKMFYMERGNWDSNLELEYNMVDIEPTSIYKLDQYGQPVAGATFSVFPANATFTSIGETAVFTGITDERGELVFKAEDGSYYSQFELKRIFGEYFVLREVAVPEGYQSLSSDIRMKFADSALICLNTAETGAYASNNILITSPNELHYGEDNTVQYYMTGNPNTNGSLFAMVLKKQGGNWYPVFGNSAAGFHVVTEGTEDERIAAARDYQMQLDGTPNGVYFSYRSGGVMQLSMDNLPGAIEEYAEYGNENPNYKIGFYWQPGDDDSVFHKVTDAYTSFKMAWGATVHVPNYENRFYYQKLTKDDTPELVAGAKFALYQADDEVEAYLTEDEVKIYLDDDTDKDYKGTAHIGSKTGTEATYEVNTDTGVITVTAGTDTYTIVPARNALDADMLGTTGTYSSSRVDVDLEGTGDFSGIPTGKYLLREVKAPDHYELNPAQIPVVVSKGEVFVNAGTEGDDVRVGIDPGRLAPSMFDMVNGPGLNETLWWITAKLNTTSDMPDGNSVSWTQASTGSFDYDSSANSAASWFDYMARNHTGDAEDVRQFTDTGWSAMTIYQDRAYAASHKDPDSAYFNLGGENADVSKLFGKAVFVQIADERMHETEILKVSANNTDQPLEGVKFDLYKTSVSDATKIMTDLTTDAEGKLSIGELPTGTYWLVETATLNGYILTEPVKIIVKPDDPAAMDGTTFEQEGNPLIAQGTAVRRYVREDDNVVLYELKITNTTGVELPHTGGPGTTLYTLSGMMLLLASALLYGFRRRHEERRSA